MAVIRKLDSDRNLLVVQLTDEEQKMVQQTIDTGSISTYLRVDTPKKN